MGSPQAARVVGLLQWHSLPALPDLAEALCWRRAVAAAGKEEEEEERWWWWRRRGWWRQYKVESYGSAYRLTNRRRGDVGGVGLARDEAVAAVAAADSRHCGPAVQGERARLKQESASSVACGPRESGRSRPSELA